MARVCLPLLLATCACGRLGFDAPDDSIRDDGDAAGEIRTSCIALSPSCGSNGTSDCCESLPVPSGTFYRSYDAAADALFPDMSFPASVSAFRLDKYEVTVGRFRKFVAAGMGTRTAPPPAAAGAHPQIPGSGWSTSWNSNLVSNTTALIAAMKCDPTYATWTDTPLGNEGRPINCITWYEAMAFCAWDDGFVPTEAEWNDAAAGGSLQRAFPWSTPPNATSIDCSLANFGGPNWPTTGCVTTGTQVVGSDPLGNGFWGHADLSGNVWEWVLDGLDVYANPCVDCAALGAQGTRVHRGGGLYNDAEQQRVAGRGAHAPGYRSIDLGVRCGQVP